MDLSFSVDFRRVFLALKLGCVQGRGHEKSKHKEKKVQNNESEDGAADEEKEEATPVPLVTQIN